MRLQADARAEFKAWAAHHGKAYLEGTAEFEQRLVHWKENVEHHIAAKNDATHPLNALMDLHDDEFKAGFLGHTNKK